MINNRDKGIDSMITISFDWWMIPVTFIIVGIGYTITASWNGKAFNLRTAAELHLCLGVVIGCILEHYR